MIDSIKELVYMRIIKRDKKKVKGDIAKEKINSA